MSQSPLPFSGSVSTAPLLMRYDPATSDAKPYPSEANQWRLYHGQTAWLFNPWTGKRRGAHEVGIDPFGLGIVPSYGLCDPLDPFIKRAAPGHPLKHPVFWPYKPFEQRWPRATPMPEAHQSDDSKPGFGGEP